MNTPDFTHICKKYTVFCKELPKSIINSADVKRLITASGSVGANYIEANEPLSKKDFVMRVKISWKEAMEYTYWLKLISETDQFTSKNDAGLLINEATESLKILSSIIEKCK